MTPASYNEVENTIEANITIPSLADVILFNDNVALLDMLLNAGADPNAIYSSCKNQDKVSDVPLLYLAFAKKNKAIIKRLVEAGANVDALVTTYSKKGTAKSFPLKYAQLPLLAIEENPAISYGWKGFGLFRGGLVEAYYPK